MTLTVATISDEVITEHPQDLPILTVPYSGNFASARNWLLKHAATEWVLMLDTDETIQDWEAVLQYTNEHTPTPTRLLIENVHDEYSTLHTAIRLLPKADDIYYEGAIHEQPQIGDRDVQYLNTRIIHTGYREASPEKWERNYRLTKAWVKQAPAENMPWYHYATLMMQKYRWHEALDYLKQIHPDTVPLEAAVRNKQATCAIHLDDIPAAKYWIEQSLDLVSWQVKGWYLLYLLARMTEERDSARTALLHMMQCEYHITIYGIMAYEEFTFPESWYQEQMREVT